jgi:hypothetical protein
LAEGRPVPKDLSFIENQSIGMVWTVLGNGDFDISAFIARAFDE